MKEFFQVKRSTLLKKTHVTTDVALKLRESS